MKIKTFTPLLVALGVALGCASVNAASIIYEPFSQTAGALNGKASSGIGLTGNWSQDQTVNVVTPPTLSYGDLENAGGQVNLSNGNGTDVWVSTSTALSTAGLLDDGATLWFSYVYQKSAHGNTNEHSGFALTTDRFNIGASGLLLNSAGYGFGVFSNNNTVSATSWSNSTTRAAGTGSASLQDSTPDTPANDGFGITLVIGRIQWNMDSALNDTLTIWTRALDDIATEPTTGGSMRSALILQDQLDTITFGARNSGGTQIYDEIRFGATFTDVAPIPEPTTALLGGLGLLALLRRRR